MKTLDIWFNVKRDALWDLERHLGTNGFPIFIYIVGVWYEVFCVYQGIFGRAG